MSFRLHCLLAGLDRGRELPAVTLASAETRTSGGVTVVVESFAEGKLRYDDLHVLVSVAFASALVAPGQLRSASRVEATLVQGAAAVESKCEVGCKVLLGDADLSTAALDVMP